VHAYNRSARLEPRAAAWFTASERRYFTTYFGARGAAALDAQASEAARAAPPAPLADGLLHLTAPAAIALSPLADFGSFAFVPRAEAGAWRPPDDVRAGFGSAAWYVRAVDLATQDVLAEGAVS
ncbi:MAG TPA: hypothetical protein VF554_16080, partial [Thermoanaerobaculia bacterium]